MHGVDGRFGRAAVQGRPGTIAEASTIGLPVLLTSHLPGQEAGNVRRRRRRLRRVRDRAAAHRRDPQGVAQPEKRVAMRAAARAAANPTATLDIARDLARMAMQPL